MPEDMQLVLDSQLFDWKDYIATERHWVTDGPPAGWSQPFHVLNHIPANEYTNSLEQRINAGTELMRIDLHHVGPLPALAPVIKSQCLQCHGRWGQQHNFNRTCWIIKKQELKQYADRHLEIRQCQDPSMGKGIFVKAGNGIGADKIIGFYLGDVRRDRNVWAQHPHGNIERSWHVETVRAQPAQLGFQLREIDSGPRYGNWTRFMNHSCLPNVKVLQRQCGGIRVVAFQARHHIPAGQELTISYGSEYFDAAEPPLQCRCARSPQPHNVSKNIVDNAAYIEP
ncbi:hypothetical protein QBC35DRAFT_448708 [Podospora australis]|uniref:SET domain-containing protein n=1 Tax=Podospora australis TaxID=1536484 RepID=A0AAN6X1C1_9PEZI|nr:hypothetical protein QBC35DRAFT_448708 [Podospora australis]